METPCEHPSFRLLIFYLRLSTFSLRFSPAAGRPYLGAGRPSLLCLAVALPYHPAVDRLSLSCPAADRLERLAVGRLPISLSHRRT
jgi:hypothetical protein